MKNNEVIKTFIISLCPVCNSEGFQLYNDLTDKLFGASGKWNLVQCIKKNCNTIWLNPAPLEEDIYKAYQKYYTHFNLAPKKKNVFIKILNKAQQSYLDYKYGYTSEIPKLFGFFLFLTPLRRSATDFNVMYLRASKGALLDLGCGSGEFILNMKLKGWDVTGIDSDSKAIQLAKSKGLNAINGNLIDQKFNQESFDAIVLSHLIEHLHDPISILFECKRLLKKGGKLVIATPNIKSLGHFIFRRNWRGLEPPRHINLFSIESLNSLISKAGFKDSKTITIPRISRDIFIKSYQIKFQDKISDKNTVSFLIKIFATVFTCSESIFNIILPSIGEEIILIVHKDK